MFVWLNGSFVDEAQASVPLRDTGLLHGAGVFTTMRSYNGRVFRIDQHLARLRDSCEVLFIPLQHKDDVLRDAASELLKRNGLADARLRLTVTRGAAQADPLHGTHFQPNVFLTASAVEPYSTEFYERGLTVIVLDEQKLNPFDLQAGHKTVNYLSRLAALREANRRGAGEALWFNVFNYLQSGSISNVFIVKDDTLITPATNAELRDANVAEASKHTKSALLPGVTRGAVLEIAALEKISIRLASIDINQLLAADEVFLTNSVMQVMPVTRIEQKAIGSNKPGPVTVRLANALADMIERDSGEPR